MPNFITRAVIPIQSQLISVFHMVWYQIEESASFIFQLFFLLLSSSRQIVIQPILSPSFMPVCLPSSLHNLLQSCLALLIELLAHKLTDPTTMSLIRLS